MIQPLQLHNMLVEPEDDENERRALMDMAMGDEEEPDEMEDEPPAQEAAASMAEQRYAQQALNRLANQKAHKKDTP